MSHQAVIDALYTAMLQRRRATLVTKKGQSIKSCRILRVNQRQDAFSYQAGGSTTNSYIWRLEEIILDA